MIQRQQLLVETLVKRQMTRQGEIYMFRKPMGPPPGDLKIDKFLHRIAQLFDFGPLFNGDQQQARQVARDYIGHLKKHAAREKIPWGKVSGRLRRSSPHLRNGLLTFFVYYDARIKSLGK
jgi:hypothetical protein